METATDPRSEPDLSGKPPRPPSLEDHCVRIFHDLLYGEIKDPASRDDLSVSISAISKAQPRFDTSESHVATAVHRHAVRLFRHFLLILLHAVVQESHGSEEAPREQYLALTELYKAAATVIPGYIDRLVEDCDDDSSTLGPPKPFRVGRALDGASLAQCITNSTNTGVLNGGMNCYLNVVWRLLLSCEPFMRLVNATDAIPSIFGSTSEPGGSGRCLLEMLRAVSNGDFAASKRSLARFWDACVDAGPMWVSKIQGDPVELYLNFSASQPFTKAFYRALGHTLQITTIGIHCLMCKEITPHYRTMTNQTPYDTPDGPADFVVVLERYDDTGLKSRKAWNAFNMWTRYDDDKKVENQRLSDIESEYGQDTYIFRLAPVRPEDIAHVISGEKIVESVFAWIEMSDGWGDSSPLEFAEAIQPEAYDAVIESFGELFGNIIHPSWPYKPFRFIEAVSFDLAMLEALSVMFGHPPPSPESYDTHLRTFIHYHWLMTEWEKEQDRHARSETTVELPEFARAVLHTMFTPKNLSQIAFSVALSRRETRAEEIQHKARKGKFVLQQGYPWNGEDGSEQREAEKALVTDLQGTLDSAENDNNGGAWIVSNVHLMSLLKAGGFEPFAASRLEALQHQLAEMQVELINEIEELRDEREASSEFQ
ncbi:hypothetical protein Q7P37_000183 [Cladosporium fusiforme]